MYRFSKEDFKRIRKAPKIMEESIKGPGSSTDNEVDEEEDRLPYMWEVPKIDRKELLLQKVGPQQFETIYGKNKADLLAQRRKPQITIPEPFNLSANRGNKLRSVFVESLLKNLAKDEYEAGHFKLVRTRIPKSTYENRFEQMMDKDNLRKEYIDVTRNINRR